MQACSAWATSARVHQLCFSVLHVGCWCSNNMRSRINWDCWASCMSQAWVAGDETYLCKLMWMMKLAVHDVSKQHEDHERNAEAVAAHGTLPLLQRHNMFCWKRGKWGKWREQRGEMKGTNRENEENKGGKWREKQQKKWWDGAAYKMQTPVATPTCCCYTLSCLEQTLCNFPMIWHSDHVCSIKQA